MKGRHAEHAFEGEGARLYGGRWNSPGTRVVYVSESRALALLEVLAGLGSVRAAAHYVLIEAEFDADLVEVLEPEALPESWHESPPRPGTQTLGDRWVREARSAVLKVPSVLVPAESNYLLNPDHPRFGAVRIGEPAPARIHPRLGR